MKKEIRMGILERHNVKTSGSGTRTIVFVHGYGCDQNMWRFITPAFEDKFKIVLLDLMGAGGSDASAYNAREYSSLHAYAKDVVDISQELKLRDAVLVGHSVSAMIAILAWKR